VKAAQEGIVSGQKGCNPPFKKWTLYNLIDADLKECTVTWKPKEICPEQKSGKDGDGKLEKFGNFEFTYFTAPPSLACTEVTEVSCKWNNAGTDVICKTDKPIAVTSDNPVPSLYVKKKLPDKTECEISTSPKVLE